MTAQMLEMARESESGFLLGYVRLMIDLQNLRVLTRAARAKKGYDYLKRALFPGGGVTAAGLTGEITPELLRQVADSVNLLPNGPRQLTHDEVYEILKESL